MQEKKILAKGLSFVPTPKPDRFSTSVDIFKFIRQLKLKHHFKESPDQALDTGGNPNLRLRSNFTPTTSHPLIDTFQKLVLYDIQRLDFLGTRVDLTLAQQTTEL